MGKFETDQRLYRIEEAIKKLAQMVVTPEDAEEIEKTLREADSGEEKDVPVRKNED